MLASVCCLYATGTTRVEVPPTQELYRVYDKKQKNKKLKDLRNIPSTHSEEKADRNMVSQKMFLCKSEEEKEPEYMLRRRTLCKI